MRHFKDWIQAYLDSLEGKTEAPRIYHFWSAVSCIAATLKRNVYIDENTFKWYPNFYIVLAARPGVAKKSTTIDLCMNLLRDERPDDFGPDESTWEALCSTIADRLNARDGRNSPASRNDALDETLSFQCDMTLTVSELGTFLKPDDINMINGLTSLFDCKDIPYTKRTKTNGNDTLTNVYLNIIAGTTEKWLQDNFSQFAGWGIASRIIFVHSAEASTPIYRPSLIIRGNEWATTRRLLKEDLLHHIGNLEGLYQFAPETDRIAKQWYDKVFEESKEYAGKFDANKWVSDFLARKQLHVHKLAMVLAASRRDVLMLLPEDMIDAIKHVESVEAEVKKVFAHSLTPTRGAQVEASLLDLISHDLEGRGNRAPKNYIVNRIAAYMEGMSATRVFDGFLARGLFRKVDASGEGVLYAINR